MDGLEAEAALLASAEASDVSSDGGKMEPMVVTTNAEDEIEADSCGYEGDVGESTKLAHALRRPSSLVLITPQGIAAKVGSPTLFQPRPLRFAPRLCTVHRMEHVGEKVSPIPKGRPSHLVYRHTFRKLAPQGRFPNSASPQAMFTVCVELHGM